MQQKTPSSFEEYDWAGITYSEGYIKTLFEYVKEHPFKNGLEIGFDQGASALAFLRACPEAELLSVDIDFCDTGNDRIAQSEVANRFYFRCVDSRLFLAGEFQRQQAENKFDFIYIDGDHLYDAVKMDLENARTLIADGGYMIVDDANPNHAHFGVGKAVDEFCAEWGYQKTALEGSPSEAVILRKI